MPDLLLGIVIGLFVGASIGLLGAALCAAAGRSGD